MDARVTTQQRAGPAPTVVVGALLALAGVMIGFRIREDATLAIRPPPVDAGAGRVVPASLAPSPGAGEVPDPLAVAVLLGDVSADRPVREFLGGSDWLRRAVVATDALAAGRVPREVLRFTAPAQRFSVERVGRYTVIAPESYRRYDAFADAVGGMSPAAVRALYLALRAPVDAVYRALGSPSPPFETRVARALTRIEAAPVPDADLVVRSDRGRFVFDDPRLEALGDVEKQLLRMGPRNARVVQDQARAIREALGLEAPDHAAVARWDR